MSGVSPTADFVRVRVYQQPLAPLYHAGRRVTDLGRLELSLAEHSVTHTLTLRQACTHILTHIDTRYRHTHRHAHAQLIRQSCTLTHSHALANHTHTPK
jgi:hypothetical protein